MEKNKMPTQMTMYKVTVLLDGNSFEVASFADENEATFFSECLKNLIRQCGANDKLCVDVNRQSNTLYQNAADALVDAHIVDKVQSIVAFANQIQMEKEERQ